MFQIEKIKEDFIKVIQHSQSIEEPKVDLLFQNWQINKANIIEAFGGKLIYEIDEPVSFELSEQGKEQKLNAFIDHCASIGLDDLSEFLWTEKEGFYQNKCLHDGFGVKKGTKLIKAFKNFVDNPVMLRKIQDEASLLIQENVVTGKLCFSVHPLDYLSISENTYNWRSCHALDGEYRAGNLSYMMDSSTIICYLKGEEEVQLPRFPKDVLWNNKKWRVLLYLSNDWKMIFAGKPYPFSTEAGMNILIDYFNYDPDDIYRKPKAKLRHRYKNAEWVNWTDYKIATPYIEDIRFDMESRYVPLNGGLLSIDELVKDADGSKHFNDVLYSSSYDFVYTFIAETGWWGEKRYPINDYNSTRFHIGYHTHCLHCGTEETMESGAASMMCYDCERDYGKSENHRLTFCHECGCRLVTDDANFVDGELYCDDCFERIGAKCEECDEVYRKENMIYDEETDAWYCSDWCHKNRRRKW